MNHIKMWALPQIQNLRRLNLLLFSICLYGLVGVTRSDDTESVPKGDEGPGLSNYMVTGTLSDGEEQRRIRWGQLVLRETFVTHQDKEGVRKGLLLRQLGSGPHFLQLIYKLRYDSEGAINHRKLVECEILEDWSAANEFRSQFRNDLKNAGLELEVPSDKHPKDEVNLNQDRNELGLDLEYDLNPNVNHDVDLDLEGDVGSDPIDLTQGLETLGNVTVRILQNDEVTTTPEMKRALSLRKQKRACNRLHGRMRQVVNAKRRERSNSSDLGTTPTRIRREAFRVGIMPGTLWCGDGSLADQYTSIGAHVGADRCCREHDGCPFLIDAMSSKYGMFNYRMHTISHCTCDERGGVPRSFRGRRDLDEEEEISSASFLQGQFPGTEWCGRGFTAKELTTLGAYTGADNCCRRHDLGCPFFIEGFQEKFGLFNWRLYTINHCSCDERFRSCLKQTNTGAANFVGKIFFNVVQTKCFLLKPERSCAKYSWLGKCLKHEYVRQAHLRDPIPY